MAMRLPAIRVGVVDDIAPGTALLIPGDTNGTGADIAVFNDAGRFHALDDECTHGAASLSDGWIEDGAVECPAHGARFSLCTGKVLALPATRPVRTHLIERRGDEVWLHPGTPSDCEEVTEPE